MKRFKNIIQGLVVTLLSLTNADALTLEQAVATAKSQNADLKEQQWKTKAASWKRLEGISTYIPKLTLEGRHLFDDKLQVTSVQLGAAPPSLFPLIVPKTMATARVTWTVFEGLQAWNEYRASAYRFEASTLEERRRAFKIEEEIRMKFYQALAVEKLAEAASENVAVLEGHRTDARNQERGGTSTRYDVLRIEVQLEVAKSDKEDAEDNVVLARIRLAEAMGTREIPTSLEGELPQPSLQYLDSYEKNSITTRDDVKAESLRAQANDEDLGASRSFWMPSVSLFGEGSYYNNTNRSITDSDSFRNAYSLGLMMKWDLFDGGKSISKERQAYYESMESQERSRKVENRASYELEVWKRKLKHSVSQYSAKLAEVQKAKESVHLARSARNAGIRTNTDVLDAELDLFKAQAGVVKSQADFVEALSELELALGQKLQ